MKCGSPLPGVARRVATCQTRAVTSSAPDPTVRIRQVAADEVAEAAEVWRRAWFLGHQGQVPDALIAARPPAYFLQKLTAWSDTTTVCVVETAGAPRIAGVVVVHGDELTQIGVDPALRGHGYGDRLLAAAERTIAVEHDLAWLSVVPGNASARAFYAARGWVDRGPRVTRSQTMTEETVEVLVHRYEKALNPRD